MQENFTEQKESPTILETIDKKRHPQPPIKACHHKILEPWRQGRSYKFSEKEK